MWKKCCVLVLIHCVLLSAVPANEEQHDAVKAAEDIQLSEKNFQEEQQFENAMQAAENALESENEENSMEKTEDGGYLTQSDDSDDGALLNEEDNDEAMEYSKDKAVDQHRCRYRSKCRRVRECLIRRPYQHCYYRSCVVRRCRRRWFRRRCTTRHTNCRKCTTLYHNVWVG